MFELDIDGAITDRVLRGLWEIDLNGDKMPALAGTEEMDVWFELDVNDDIIPRVEAHEAVFPDEGDVDLGVEYGFETALVGTSVDPVESDVRVDIQYGAGGTEFTGTLLTEILSPLLTVSDNGDETVLVTVAGSTIGSTNEVFIRSVDGVYPGTPQLTFSGDDSSSLALTPGGYYGKVRSTKDDSVNAGSTDPVYFVVASTSLDTAFYRVIRIERIPGSQTKRALVERIERPIEP